ncbi:hypothetical protein CJU90_2260 [Yarrowia sp. C11]|nr:hypothetical protein CJU90_2260 [Yarrowia sp. C11]
MIRHSPRVTPTKSQWPAKTVTPTQPQTQTQEKENNDDRDYSPSVISRASCEPLSASASPSPLPNITVAKRQRQDYMMGNSPPPFQIRQDSEVQTSTPVGNATLKAFENLDISGEITTPKKRSTELSVDTPTKSRASIDSLTRTVSITLSSIYDELNETPRKKRPLEARAPSTLPRRKRSGFLRHRPSKLDLIDHKELTFFPLHAQASDCGNSEPLVFVEDYFVSDYERSRKNPDASVKKCTTCFAPLYEFSSFLDSLDKRDACKYSEFVCTKCAHKAFPNRSTALGRSVRKAQSSYELRSRPPLAQSASNSSSRPMWWDSLSRKLRWRWRTKGLIPKDVLDLINPPAPPSHY